MGIIATGLQTRQKDDYATSDSVKLTVRTNAEERTSLFGPSSGVVPAGIDAPAVAPSGSVGGGGTLSGYYVYAYVYASTKYPNVQNAVKVANGESWPRSNPSPVSSVQDASAGSKTVTLTLTKTTQPGIDKILIYRTVSSATSGAASTLGAAGELFYIGTAANNGIAGTVAFSDTGLTDTGEELELDNYPAPTAEFCEFDGTYWWIAGNCEFSAAVTLAGTSVVAVTSDYSLFSGRNGQLVTFDGVTSGGFDGVGTFYGKITATNQVTLYQTYDPETGELSTPISVPFSGTTTMYIRGFSNILWRSKPLNPFSWGIIETSVVDGNTLDVPQLFALDLGGGNVTAIAVSPNGKRLVIHFDSPQRTCAYDLEFADNAQFGLTQQLLDNTNSVTANFTLFNGQWGNNPVLFGLDTYNGQILICDGYEQHSIADDFGHFLEELPRDNRAHKFFCGAYDTHTDLNCFWVRYYDTPERNNIMVWVHAVTQYCGWTPDFDVLSSGQFLDSESGERMIFGGTELGFFGRLLCPGQFFNWSFLYGRDRRNGLSADPNTLGMDWNAQYGDGQLQIEATNPSGGVFHIVGRPNFAVGQQIVIRSTVPASIDSYVVAAISFDEEIMEGDVTLTTAYTATFDEQFVSAHPRYYGNTWTVGTNGEVGSTPATAFYYLKNTFSSFVANRPLFTTDYAIPVGDADLDISPSITALAIVQLYLGGIATTNRCYYNLTHPTINKKCDEVWLTASQYGGDDEEEITTLPACRFYIQYENDWLNLSTAQGDGPFGLNRLDSVAEVTSIVFTNNTDVPSYEPKSFGFEFIECGQNDYQMFDYTIKVSETGP